MNNKLNIIELRDVIRDCNINFLIGSGLSMPYLSTLGEIEKLLVILAEKREKGEINNEQEKIIKVSLYRNFFDVTILKNINILRNDSEMKDVLSNYNNFLKTINSIILNRKSSILSKQINIFTTNIDIFLEKALDSIKVEYNDGFSGCFNPLFDLGNFKKSFFKKSLHYDNTFELPVFNLMKVHGSLTWKKEKNQKEINILFDHDLRLIEAIKKIVIPINEMIDFEAIKKKFHGKKSKTPLDDLMKEMIKKSNKKKLTASVNEFINEYEKLSIVNPTKEKFKETVLNQNYYELLRIYSNELEKENTVLFVMGFSFADEHIRDVTMRAADSNPTLKIYIFSHTNEAEEGIQKILDKSSNNNVEIISPPQKKLKKKMVDKYKYDFQNLNKKVFTEILKKINDKE